MPLEATRFVGTHPAAFERPPFQLPVNLTDDDEENRSLSPRSRTVTLRIHLSSRLPHMDWTHSS